MSSEVIFAIGKLGQKVRLITITDVEHARTLRQHGEVMAVLNSMPNEPIMITGDGSDVVGIPLTLAQVQAARWIEAKAFRKVREGAGCTTAKGMIQTDPESRANINAAAADALRWKIANLSTTAATVTVTAASSSWSRIWTMADNTAATMTADDMTTVADAVSMYLDSVHQAGVAVRSAIAAAKTVEAVAFVDITNGYP